MQLVVQLKLYGPTSAVIAGAGHTQIKGRKHKALLFLLAKSADGKMRRADLQAMLWGQAAYDCGNQNVRRALSDLRGQCGEVFNQILDVSNDEIAINLELIQFVGGPSDGAFLEDLEIPHPRFREWVGRIRDIATKGEHGKSAALPLAQPKIAFLPLAHLGDDATLAAVGDWISQHCCRILSCSKLLTVISHLSSRALTHQTYDISNMKSDLGADFVLCGSLQHFGGGLVADVDFIDTATGEIMWSERLACSGLSDLGQIVASLLQMSQKVSISIGRQILSSIQSRALAEVADHHLIIAGTNLMHRRTLRSFLSARSYLDEAHCRNKNASEPLVWLAKWYVLNVMNGYSLDDRKDAANAEGLCNRALDLDPESSLALAMEGFVKNNLIGDFEMAGYSFDAALSINPNESLAWLLRGTQKAFSGDGKAAVAATMKARELSPIDPFGYYYDSLASTAHLASGEFSKALEFANKSLARNDRHTSTHRAKITALHNLDRTDDAILAAVEMRKVAPSFSLARYRENHPVAQHRLGHLVIDALGAAGIQ